MKQIDKGKAVFVRQGSSVLRGDAPASGTDTRAVEVLTAPATATVSEPPLTVFEGTVEIELTSGKKALVAVRRVVVAGVVAGQGSNITVLPTAELLAAV